jgi:hypothetical protein
MASIRIAFAAVLAALTLPVCAATDPPRLANISTRMQVLTGNDRMIAGFVIGGTGNKTVVINVAGPSLNQYGLNGLADPTLTLVRASDQAVIATNDDWQTQSTSSNVAAIQATGFQPNHAKEPALIATLPPGAYTAIVEGVGGSTGAGLVGVFEVNAPDSPLINISTRGQVKTGNDVMIAGFVVQGSGPQKVVINVAGPSLNSFSLNGLNDPVLTLTRSDGTVIATNDSWQNQANSADFATLQFSGFQPQNAVEPALVATLSPGSYTAIVSGASGTTGAALVGVFVGPDPAQSEKNCAAAADAFTYTGQFKDFSIRRGGVAAFKLPNVTKGARHAEMIAFQSTATPSDLQSEVAISSACGSFDVAPECTQSGSSWSSIDLYAFSSNMGYCKLTPGTTYYVNVRNVVNGVNSCKASSCAQRLQYIGDLL